MATRSYKILFREKKIIRNQSRHRNPSSRSHITLRLLLWLYTKVSGSMRHWLRCSGSTKMSGSLLRWLRCSGSTKTSGSLRQWLRYTAQKDKAGKFIMQLFPDLQTKNRPITDIRQVHLFSYTILHVLKLKTLYDVLILGNLCYIALRILTLETDPNFFPLLTLLLRTWRSVYNSKYCKRTNTGILDLNFSHFLNFSLIFYTDYIDVPRNRICKKCPKTHRVWLRPGSGSATLGTCREQEDDAAPAIAAPYSSTV
jgi:hypothetical protein